MLSRIDIVPAHVRPDIESGEERWCLCAEAGHGENGRNDGAQLLIGFDLETVLIEEKVPSRWLSATVEHPGNGCYGGCARPRMCQAVQGACGSEAEADVSVPQSRGEGITSLPGFSPRFGPCPAWHFATQGDETLDRSIRRSGKNFIVEIDETLMEFFCRVYRLEAGTDIFDSRQGNLDLDLFITFPVANSGRCGSRR